jgi:DNA polymerase-1
MLQLEDELYGSAEQLLQIHDSILVECLPEEAENVAAIMRRVMEAVAPELKIILKVDVSVGKHWGEL